MDLVTFLLPRCTQVEGKWVIINEIYIATLLLLGIYGVYWVTIDLTIYRKDRVSHGGGVMLVGHSSISSKPISSPNTFKLICVEMKKFFALYVRFMFHRILIWSTCRL